MVGVCSSLNSMNGEKPRRCKPYPLHLQKNHDGKRIALFPSDSQTLASFHHFGHSSWLA